MGTDLACLLLPVSFILFFIFKTGKWLNLFFVLLLNILLVNSKPDTGVGVE